MTYPNLVIALFPEVEPAASGLEAGGGATFTVHVCSVSLFCTICTFYLFQKIYIFHYFIFSWLLYSSG